MVIQRRRFHMELNERLNRCSDQCNYRLSSVTTLLVLALFLLGRT